MEIKPIILEGRVARLEPLALDHAQDLIEQLAAHPDILRYHIALPDDHTPEGGIGYVKKILAIPAMQPFAVIDKALQKAVGLTTFMDIRAAHKGLEIGNTWIGKAYHGSLLNPECKYMLLRHAFEEQGAIRVQLKTDSRNIQSQRAIEKLGAVKEGILRRQFIMPDGYLRDSVMYSITFEEWAEVKARLETRLGYVP